MKMYAPNQNPSPYPNQQPFTFFTPIPSPNPNPNPNPCVIPNPNLHHSLPPSTPPSTSLPASVDLSTTLSNLKSLIDLSNQALTSISKFLPVKPQHGNLVRCPFNPHHRMPPESIFNHYLRCPTSLDLSSAVELLNYPKTLKSSQELAEENRFVQTLCDPNAELCFTLDGYSDFRSNFFYRDCPGVVSFPCEDSAVRRTFTLPGFLSVECANFVSGNGGEAEGTDALDVGILPSNLWGIQSEIGTWNDYPSACSRGVVCAIVGLGKVKEGDLKRWIITSSPRFGVPIDVAMRDHVVVLFSLCLKAIVREGLDLLKARNLDVKHSSMTMLACPILVRAMMWLASQLSVLYGEMHGKFFALDLLKKSTVHAASHLSLCPSSRKEIVDSNVENGSDRSLFARCEVKKPVEKNECELDTVPSQSIHGNMVFVSQVAAAVAALHERALLEEKIRALKQLQVPPRYQRLVEHTDISTRANEERQKRLGYRPIIDHDGLPRQPLSLQETSQPKTKEQLLAEERDYKRRRISYRGKKSKRNPSEVVKDIIEEYMEEIKQAGGIGCFEKIDGGTLLPGSLSTVDKEGRRSHAKEEGANSSQSQFYFVANTRSEADNDIAQHDEQPRSYPRYSDGLPKGGRGGMLVEDYDSRSPERRKHGRSYEHNNYHGERNHSQVNRVKHREFERSSSGRSDYHRPESYSSRNDMQDDERKSKSRHRRHRNIDERSPGFLGEDAFEDRYDPSRSHD